MSKSKEAWCKDKFVDDNNLQPRKLTQVELFAWLIQQYFFGGNVVNEKKAKKS